jgi:hypothetical protein
LLTSRFSGGRSVNYLGYSWISPGGGRAYLFLSGGTNHARKEPGRSRDSPVTLLHCSIRTRRIRTTSAVRRAQRGSPAQGWRVRTVAGIRPANPFSAWIHGSVPEVQPRPCGMVSDRFGEHPCAGEGQLGVPLPGVASRTGQPRISSGRRVALCAGLSAGSSACIDQQWLAVASCREIEPVRTVGLPAASSISGSCSSIRRTNCSNAAPQFSVRPRGACQPECSRAITTTLRACVLRYALWLAWTSQGHLMVRSLSSEAIWFQL